LSRSGGDLLDQRGPAGVELGDLDVEVLHASGQHPQRGLGRCLDAAVRARTQAGADLNDLLDRQAAQALTQLGRCGADQAAELVQRLRAGLDA